jgi:UDP-N-acetylenolpyruvoylglucosamine reductase
MNYRCLVVSLEGNDKEITEKLNEVLSTIEAEGGEVLEVETSLAREHGIDGFVVLYTIKYRAKRELVEE